MNSTHKLSRKVKMGTKEILPPTQYLLTDRQGSRAGENGGDKGRNGDSVHQMTDLETRHPAQHHKRSV